MVQDGLRTGLKEGGLPSGWSSFYQGFFCNTDYNKELLYIQKVACSEGVTFHHRFQCSHLYKDRVTNEEVLARIQQAIGPHKDLLTIVKRCKLQWYGHVSPFIRSGQNHLARYSERGKKTGQTEEEVGRQHQGMDRPGVRQVPEGSGEQGRMEETGCKIICGAPTTFAVKG